MLTKTLLPPLISFVGGIGTLRASVLAESYLLLGTGLLLSMTGVLWLAGSTPGPYGARRTAT